MPVCSGETGFNLFSAHRAITSILVGWINRFSGGGVNITIIMTAAPTINFGVNGIEAERDDWLVMVEEKLISPPPQTTRNRQSCEKLAID